MTSLVHLVGILCDGHIAISIDEKGLELLHRRIFIEIKVDEACILCSHIEYKSSVADSCGSRHGCCLFVFVLFLAFYFVFAGLILEPNVCATLVSSPINLRVFVHEDNGIVCCERDIPQNQPVCQRQTELSKELRC